MAIKEEELWDSRIRHVRWVLRVLSCIAPTSTIWGTSAQSQDHQMLRLTVFPSMYAHAFLLLQKYNDFVMKEEKELWMWKALITTPRQGTNILNLQRTAVIKLQVNKLPVNKWDIFPSNNNNNKNVLKNLKRAN